MRLAASMAITSLQDAAATSAPPAALPVLQLWYDGHRAAVGNSRHQAVWIVDLTGAQASVELSGMWCVDGLSIMIVLHVMGSRLT